jgi:hypothetical protein
VAIKKHMSPQNSREILKEKIVSNTLLIYFPPKNNSGNFLIQLLNTDHVGGRETTSLNRGHQRAYCSSPRWYMCVENLGEVMIPTGENTWHVHQSSLAILSAESSGVK